MMLTGKLHQVTLKSVKESSSGRLGLAWLKHCMEHYGLTLMLDQVNSKAKGSNREISSSLKVMSSALSVIGGGDRLEDIEVLRQDKGLLDALGWESMVSPDTLREYLKLPRSGGCLRLVNDRLSIKVMRESVESGFTYDNDATYFDSEKATATYSYQKRRQYSGLLGFIAELGLCNTVDFRPGHVSPSSGILNQLRKANRQALCAGKRILRFRSDSAAHSNEIFNYCNERGIKYFISLSKNAGVMESIHALGEDHWQPLPDCADVFFSETVYATNAGCSMRMLVLRWKRSQRDLFEGLYGYHAIATNDNEIDSLSWLEVHNARMGSENNHKELKRGLNGGYAPSNNFNLSRGYFLINVLALNMLVVLKRFYLGRACFTWTVKRLRWRFLNVCGRMIRSGRRWYCKVVNVTPETFELYLNCKSRLMLC